MFHMQHIDLEYSFHIVRANYINIYLFVVTLGMINQFDVLTCDESIFTRLFIVYQ